MGLEALSRGARVLFFNIKICFYFYFKKFNILFGSKLPSSGAFWISELKLKLIEKKIQFLINVNQQKWKNEAYKFNQFIEGHNYNNIKFIKILINILN